MTNIDVLRHIALEQCGYVATQQALDKGVTHAALSMLVKRGRLERASYGIYRVPQIPYTPYDSFMLAVLWTGVPEAVISHETALDLYNVCDINPTSIHITVGKSRRINRAGGESYTVHRQDLTKEQMGWVEGIPTVTLVVAVEQCIASGIPGYLIIQAIERGEKLGKLVAEEPKYLMNLLGERDGE